MTCQWPDQYLRATKSNAFLRASEVPSEDASLIASSFLPGPLQSCGSLVQKVTTLKRFQFWSLGEVSRFDLSQRPVHVIHCEWNHVFFDHLHIRSRYFLQVSYTAWSFLILLDLFPLLFPFSCYFFQLLCRSLLPAAWAPFNLPSKLDDAGLKDVDPGCHHGHRQENDGEVGLGQGRDGRAHLRQKHQTTWNKLKQIKNVFRVQFQTDSAKRNSESLFNRDVLVQCLPVLRGKALERTTRAWPVALSGHLTWHGDDCTATNWDGIGFRPVL